MSVIFEYCMLHHPESSYQNSISYLVSISDQVTSNSSLFKTQEPCPCRRPPSIAICCRFCNLSLSLFVGYFLSPSNFPPWLMWVSGASYTRYVFAGSMQAIYGFNRDKMVVVTLWLKLSFLYWYFQPCQQKYCHYKYPVKFLQEFSLDEEVWK